MIKARLSRLQAGFWWTAIYHVEVKGQSDCPAYSMSGISPGRCLWDATTQLTEQQQVMDAEWVCPILKAARMAWYQYTAAPASTEASNLPNTG